MVPRWQPAMAGRWHPINAVTPWSHQGAAPSPHDAILLFNNEDVIGVRAQRWQYFDQTYYCGLTVNFEAGGFKELYDMHGVLRKATALPRPIQT